VVTVSFELPQQHPALERLAENGLDTEPGEPLVIRRIVKADGGSRAMINDQSASVALLREIGATLVEVHGQHDDRGLLNPRGHRALLDAYGRIDPAPAARAWRRYRSAEAMLAAARAEQDAAERDREWLEHAVAELDALAPEPGEEEGLAQLRASMQTGQRLSAELATIGEQLEGSDGALSLLRQAARRLDRIASDHERLAEALAAVDRAVIEASEAEDKLAQAVEELAFDPRRLEEAEARLFEIRAAARKHRVAPDDLPGLAEELSARLQALQAGGGRIDLLQAEAAAARSDYLAAADALSTARSAAAKRLDAAVAAELKPLKLDAARFGR
jgi:DNA repair protein RecN (Recombination protein N)